MDTKAFYHAIRAWRPSEWIRLSLYNCVWFHVVVTLPLLIVVPLWWYFGAYYTTTGAITFMEVVTKAELHTIVCGLFVNFLWTLAQLDKFLTCDYDNERRRITRDIRRQSLIGLAIWLVGQISRKHIASSVAA